VNVLGDKFCKAFGEANDTKDSTKQLDGPQQRLGTEQRLARGMKAIEQRENG